MSVESFLLLMKNPSSLLLEDLLLRKSSFFVQLFLDSYLLPPFFFCGSNTFAFPTLFLASQFFGSFSSPLNFLSSTALLLLFDAFAFFCFASNTIKNLLTLALFLFTKSTSFFECALPFGLKFSLSLSFCFQSSLPLTFPSLTFQSESFLFLAPLMFKSFLLLSDESLTFLLFSTSTFLSFTTFSFDSLLLLTNLSLSLLFFSANTFFLLATLSFQPLLLLTNFSEALFLLESFSFLLFHESSVSLPNHLLNGKVGTSHLGKGLDNLNGVSQCLLTHVIENRIGQCSNEHFRFSNLSLSGVKASLVEDFLARFSERARV
mmetsp:Transcript_2737/g.10520  ORF Transcript_2737/g.10520 Transcript_2737/m.10520 type:complete len:319 (+) Transcript_2737:581-1537(+)